MTVGGTSMVNHRLFDGFAYVALGHLHRPQSFGEKGNVVYSGSPLPYSFSEAHEKSVVILDTQTMRTQRLPVGVGRQVVTISGELSEILSSPRHKAAEDKFVRIQLTDTDVQIGAIDRVRERFPHVLELTQGAMAGDGTIEELVGGKTRSVSEEVAAYTEQYFPIEKNPYKHELASNAVMHALAKTEAQQ
jgi:exonuclease SbcD